MLKVFRRRASVLVVSGCPFSCRYSPNGISWQCLYRHLALGILNLLKVFKDIQEQERKLLYILWYFSEGNHPPCSYQKVTVQNWCWPTSLKKTVIVQNWPRFIVFTIAAHNKASLVSSSKHAASHPSCYPLDNFSLQKNHPAGRISKLLWVLVKPWCVLRS